jgi:hypothetical protein
MRTPKSVVEEFQDTLIQFIVGVVFNSAPWF